MTLSVNANNQVLATANLTGKTAFDSNSLNNLKIAAKDNSPEAIKAVAKQFEAVFMNMMLKSMREATSQDSPFDNEQSRTFTSMLDQQLSQSLSSKGLGLTDILTRQLSKASGISETPLAKDNLPIKSLTNSNLYNSKPSAANADDDIFNIDAITQLSRKFTQPVSQAYKEIKSAAQEYAASASGTVKNIASQFQAQMTSHAESASRSTGVPASFMMGQAALESGWGKREIKAADGTPSNNLFGIKATGNWNGKVVEAVTTEYVNGVKQKRVEKFRAYDSYADSFKDFANLMQKNPRYQNVMANLHNVNDYAKAMQNAGYATDPQYANKLASVIKKIASS